MPLQTASRAGGSPRLTSSVKGVEGVEGAEGVEGVEGAAGATGATVTPLPRSSPTTECVGAVRV